MAARVAVPRLTELGQEVLARYRRMEMLTAQVDRAGDGGASLGAWRIAATRTSAWRGRAFDIVISLYRGEGRRASGFLASRPASLTSVGRCFFGIALSALACPAAGAFADEPPTIAAASDLQFALTEVAKAFTAETGLEVKLAFGSSGNFARQIRQGAPFEMYLSADENYVLELAKDGFTRDDGALYAVGRIVIIVPHGSPLEADGTLEDLRAALEDGRVQKFAIANPEHAPYGRAGRGGVAPRRPVGSDRGPAGARRERLAGGAVRHVRLDAGRHHRLFAGALAQSLRARHIRADPGGVARSAAPAHGAAQGRGGHRRALLRVRPAACSASDHAPIRLRAAGRGILRLARDGLDRAPALFASLVVSRFCCCCRSGSGPDAVSPTRTSAAKGLSRRWLRCRWCCRRRCSATTCSWRSAAASPIGQVWQSLFDRPLVFTFEGLLVASVIFNLPFAIQPMQRGFEAIPREVREAAACCGMSPWRALLRIELPLAWPGILTAMVLSFAHTLGEFGIVLMVGGSIPGETKTIAIAIYDRVQAFDDVAAAQMAALLLAISLATIALTYGLSRRVGRRLG